MSAPRVAPRSGGAPSADRPAFGRGKSAGQASVLPLAIGIGALVVSIALAIWAVVSVSAPVMFFGLSLPLVSSDAWMVSAIGYFLTPCVVIACYGWDAIAQRRGPLANPNYVTKPAYRRALLWTVGIGIAVGAWHILNLSVPLSEALGLS